MIKLAVPSIEEDDLKAVRDTLASGQLVQGKQVAAFESRVAERSGTRHAVAVSNCTAALHLALLALRVNQGDIVLVTAYSWISTANVIELCGARPLFVDIEPDTFNLDPNRLEDKLKSLSSDASKVKRVKAILAADIFGQMADYASIVPMARNHGIPVIEDAACSIGATLSGMPAGAWGAAGCFSFHPRKAVTTGEGGIVATNDDGIARTVRMLRNHGLDPDAAKPDFVIPGYNYRMTEFQAALGQTQMAKLDRILESRKKSAAQYHSLLEGSGFTIPAARRGLESHVYQSYVVLLPRQAAAAKTEIIQNLKQAGVETTIGTWHMPMTTYYKKRYGFQRGDFPIADDVFERALTLPLFESMTADEQEETVRLLRKAVEKI